MNDAYGALGEHYMTAIMPTQVRKPKQKASAEGAVKDAAAWAIARLRSRVFADFDEVAAAADASTSTTPAPSRNARRAATG